MYFLIPLNWSLKWYSVFIQGFALFCFHEMFSFSLVENKDVYSITFSQLDNYIHLENASLA